jgi:hypothetical protein
VTLGHRTSCHQPRTALAQRRRGGRAPTNRRSWVACSRRSVLRCSASSWLSPACWLFMCPSLRFRAPLPAERPSGTGPGAADGKASPGDLAAAGAVPLVADPTMRFSADSWLTATRSGHGRSTGPLEQQGITAMTKVAAPTAHTATAPSSRPDGGSASLAGRPTMAPTGPRRNADWPVYYAAGTAARARLDVAVGHDRLALSQRTISGHP